MSISSVAMTSITLQVNGHELALTVHGGSGRIDSHLPRETCPFCGLPECGYTCGESQADYAEKDSIDRSESGDEVGSRLRYNAVLDAIERLALAHACAGLDVTDPRYIAGLEAAMGRG